MAARGARSRKVLDKTIEKQDRKREAESVSGLGRPDSPDWDLPAASRSDPSTRSFSSKTVPTRPTRHGSHSRAGSRASTASGISTMSVETKDTKPKYQAKGKETSHPRGRGGGVPNKAGASADRPPTRTENARSPTEPRPAVPKKWANMLLWPGNGQKPQPYRGFQYDSDMWMATGDCYIYFAEETDELHPRPCLRLHVSELEKAQSTLLSNTVRYSVIEPDVDEISVLPRTPNSRSLFSPRPGRSSLAGSEDPRSPRWDSIEVPVRPQTRSPTGSDGPRSPGSQHRFNRAPQDSYYSPTSDIASSAGGWGRNEVEITHEIWFRAPAYLKTPQAQLRHHIAQRNFFALLYQRPLVGSDFFEMLSELQTVIDTFYELDNKAQTQWGARMIARYLLIRRLDDIRGNMRMALGSLAWCEQDNVRWMAGYLEAFVHCAGMMTPHATESHEFKRLSTVTRMNLKNAANMLQLRVLEAEERLASFDPADIWPSQGSKGDAVSSHQKSFAALQEFLMRYYGKVYRAWPPPTNSKGRWLTRDVVRRLQQDLGSLYDYLVDRTVTWSEQESRASRKWQMVTTNPLPEPLLSADAALPLTDILIGFDNRHGYLHIPHPFPLLPQSIKITAAPTPAKKGLFSGLKKSKAPPTRDRKEMLQVAAVFNDANNLDKLGVAFEGSPMIDRYERYEKEVDIPGISPREARLGRWILLYSVLQILSSLSVDTQKLKYKDGVDYFLCASLKKCPPWDPNGQLPMVEACQTQSYCWTAPDRWERAFPTIVDNTSADPPNISEPFHRTSVKELDGDEAPISELDGKSIVIGGRRPNFNKADVLDEAYLNYEEKPTTKYRVVDRPPLPPPTVPLPVPLPLRIPLQDKALAEKLRERELEREMEREKEGGYYNSDEINSYYTKDELRYLER